MNFRKTSLLATGMLFVFLLTNRSFAQTDWKFTKGLQRGYSGVEIQKLQEFLSSFPELYPEKLITGYFGPATERAVKNFQARYVID